MTKDDLMDLAAEMGIQDKIHYKDKKSVIIKKIWKNLG
jgi:hypothetical protein